MLNVAVIGLGNMGRHHARIYAEFPNTNLVAISDLDENRCKELSAKHNCKYYLSFEEMLEKEKLDAVSIVVPTKFHKNVALKTIEKGIHTFIEKPIADTIENAELIIKKAKEKGVKLMIGHIERFNPAVQKLKEIIDQGRLGDITSIIARRVGLFPPQIKDANVIIDLAVHDIDVMNYLLDKEPTEVIGTTGKALIDKREDCAEIMLKYNGTSGFIQVNWITPIKIRNLAVTGTKGYAELNYISQDLTLFESNYKKDYDDFGDFIIKFGNPNKVEVGVDKEEPLKLELKHFIDCVEKNKEPLVTGEKGLAALKIAFQVIGK